MAARLTGRPWLAAALLALPLPLRPALAEPLPDPTRPPPEAMGPAEREAAAGRAAAPSRGLQAVMIAPTRRAAIINGRTVELGEKYGGATLVEVREGYAVLRDTKGNRTTLMMFPKVGIDRREAAKRPPPRMPEDTEQRAPKRARPRTAPPEGQ